MSFSSFCNEFPAVSVIMPAYNSGQILADAIESVLRQSCGSFELVIVDDASTDDTGEVAQYFRSCDPRVHLVTNAENSRSSPVPWEPRNDAIRVARAPLIAYLDADNTWESNFLESMMGVFARQRGIVLTYCDSKNHYASLEQMNAVITRDTRDLCSVDVDGLAAAFSCTIDTSKQPGIDWYVDTNEIMHRASVFERLGGLWNTVHPRRQSINDAQIIRCPYRRHNDQDFVERVLNEYGIAAIFHNKDVLTNFYYRGAYRPVANRPLQSRIRDERDGVEGCVRSRRPVRHDAAIQTTICSGLEKLDG